MITIDGTAFDIPFLGVDRAAEFLDKFASRTNDGELHRELIGVFFNYDLKLGDITDMDLYNSLFDKLTEAVEFHVVTVPDATILGYTFTAYFSGITDQLRKEKNGKFYWSKLTVNFKAKSPRRRPA